MNIQPNRYSQCTDTACWCNQPKITSGYVTTKVLEPIAPHTNPAYHDQFSMYQTIGPRSEVFVMYHENHLDGEPHVKSLVLYHTPTGERIEITVDPNWKNDPTYSRENAEARIDRHESI